MSNETKRDVFDAVVNSRWRFLAGNTKDEPTDDECMMAYDAAPPDDLPVIPKAVGEYLKSNRTEPLGKVFWHLGCISVTLLGSTRSYIVDHSEDFARAWVLGVWRVEETGEIVKLEEEK